MSKAVFSRVPSERARGSCEHDKIVLSVKTRLKRVVPPQATCTSIYSSILSEYSSPPGRFFLSSLQHTINTTILTAGIHLCLHVLLCIIYTEVPFRVHIYLPSVEASTSFSHAISDTWYRLQTAVVRFSVVVLVGMTTVYG